MKIGASTLAIYGEKIGENLEFFEKFDLEYVEILHQYPCENIDIELLNTFKLKYTVHSPIIDTNIASLSSNILNSSVKSIKDSINLANNLDSEIVVVHPGTIPFLGKSYEKEIYNKSHESLKEISKYGKDLGVVAAIENMPDIEGFIYKDLEKLNEFLEINEMYMTLDIGHANTLNYSENEMYFDSIKHIHLSDNYGDDDSHLPLGEGEINFKSIINKFQSKKYDGIYMIEVNDKESVKKSLEFMKELI
ncbi:MAG: sugar phosphate isomerase/epimerase [Methanobacteriaceae archaeon]|jgi:sugar phosphate isomerase/epimerase|nr:sugar phosphate isomerase/epimerase [Methanobacteriaceae archaeon]